MGCLILYVFCCWKNWKWWFDLWYEACMKFDLCNVVFIWLGTWGFRFKVVTPSCYFVKIGWLDCRYGVICSHRVTCQFLTSWLCIRKVFISMQDLRLADWNMYLYYMSFSEDVEMNWKWWLALIVKEMEKFRLILGFFILLFVITRWLIHILELEIIP